MIDSAVYQLLAGFPGVATLVGDQIYPLAAADGVTGRYIVFTDQAPVPDADELDGAGDLATARVQVDAWAATTTDARELAHQARLALKGFTGVVAGIRIADIYVDGGFHDFDDDPPPRLYRSSRDFMIQFYEEE